MIKGHSAGIGDLLRSTPAWRALKDRYGAGVQLHLVLLTREPGYLSESFIAQQALLKGFSVIPKTGSGWQAWREQLRQLEGVAARFQPDLVIDFEPHGSRSALLTAALHWRRGVATVGIAQFPGRGLLYQHAAPRCTFKWDEGGRVREIDYTDRDFAALAALGIRRDGRAIEMSLTPEGIAFGTALRERFGVAAETPLLGVNIGCGTPGAEAKRPDLTLLAQVVRRAQAAIGGVIVLTGAPNEREINEEFMRCLGGMPGPLVNLAGETDLYALGGTIAQCRAFISSDSGPYHMAVALRRPTLVLFNWRNDQAFHQHPWVRKMVRAEQLDDTAQACRELDDLLEAAS